MQEEICNNSRLGGHRPHRPWLLRSAAVGKPIVSHTPHTPRLGLLDGPTTYGEEGASFHGTVQRSCLRPGRPALLPDSRTPWPLVPPCHSLLQKVARDYCTLWRSFRSQTLTLIPTLPLFRWVPDTRARGHCPRNRRGKTRPAAGRARSGCGGSSRRSRWPGW
jgi:hypothetical protein